MAIHIESEFMAAEVNGAVVATARWSWYAAADGNGAWIAYVHEQVPGLLLYPRLDRMLGGSEDPDAAGAVLDDGKDVDASLRICPAGIPASLLTL